MIIKQITLNNFRQYKGKQDPIEFSMDKDKNVTVILGVNTSGKTTFIQAFNWCLYGKTTFNTKDLLNVEVFNSMEPTESATVSVEIELIHENRLYIIRRSQKILKQYDGRAKVDQETLKVQYKEQNGEMQEISFIESQNTINKILPEGLSDYFFFDGEHIADINNKKDVSAAIKGLMGLDVIGEAVKHLNPSLSSSVVSKLRKELDIGNDTRNSKLKEDIINEKRDLESVNKQIEQTTEEIEYFEDRKSKLEEIIRSNQVTKQKQLEKDRIERNIRYLESNIVNSEKRLVSDFSKNGFKFFASPLYEKAIKVLSEAKDEGEGIPDMHSKAIEYILKRGRCICGCDLTKNQGAVEAINYEKSLLPPENIGTIIRKYRENCKQFKNDVEDYYDNIKSDYMAIRQAANQISEEKQRFDEFSKELLGNDDVSKYEAENRDNEQKLKEARDLLMRRREQRGALMKSIEDKEKEVNRLTATTSKNIRIKRNINYAIALYEWFNQSYDLKEKKVKEDLYESVNRIFAEMYHGKRVVEINNDYRIVLKSRSETGNFVTDTSPGLDTVKNFAFISGLVDLAKQRANSSNNENLEKVEPYPIVMDAPFSNADEIHIENISKVLPSVAEQVILVVMQKDWEYAKKTITNKTAMIYEIEKFNETNSSIRRIV